MMKQLLYAASTLLALVLMLALLKGPTETPRASTLEVLVQPEAAQALEAQRLAAQTEQARIAAELEAAAQRERTRRTLIVAGAVVAVALCCAAIWGVLTISKRQHNSYILLPGAPGFHAALLDIGGRWDQSTPIDSHGREIKYLEVEE